MYTEDNSMVRSMKTLGEAEARFLSTLASQDKSIFTTEDAREVTGSSVPATNSLISNLLRKRWLIRLNRGTYLIVPLSAGDEAEYSENWFVVAKHLIDPEPYYLSHFSALEIHEMTTQPVLTVYISTPARRIPKEIAGATYRFVHARPDDLWGTEGVWVTPSQQVQASDFERTVIDCLDRPDLCGGVIEVARGLWSKREQIDFAKLGDYVARMGRKSVAKRLGFLLDVYGIGTAELRDALGALVTAGYVLLDPTLPPEGRHTSKWKVRSNIDVGELLSATQT